MMEMVTEIIAWASFPLGALLAGASLAVAIFYTKHHHFPHIVCMAVSFSIMVMLLVLTLNFRIFYDGWQRFAGAVSMLIAFTVALIGLVIIFKWRGKDVRER